MSLDHYTTGQRAVIDLTTNPPMRYADRFALPGMPPRPVSRPAPVVTAVAPTRSGSMRINVLSVLAVSSLAAVGILLVGIVATTLF